MEFIRDNIDAICGMIVGLTTVTMGVLLILKWEKDEGDK